MDFTFTEEQDSLREAVRDLLGAHRSEPTPGDPSFDAKLWRALAEMGTLGLPFTEEAGGMGAGPVEVMIVASELGRAGVRSPYAETMVAGTLVGDDALLGSLCDGSALVVPALTEPGRAWSPLPVGVVLSGGAASGVRAPVPYAAAADHVVTTARAGDSTAILAVDAPVSSTLDLAGKAIRVLAEDGEATVRRAINLGILALGAEALGAMDTALALTVDYLKTRKQFGVPLARFQTLTQRAADMYTSVELTRSVVYFAAMSLAADPDDDVAIARLKVSAGKAGRHVGQEAVQLHGGIGVTAEYAVSHLLARLTAIEHTYGDTRYHLARLARRVGDYGALDLMA
jgi:alkylation response protein AidB-like acyl-CoA dehydrogenase